MMILDDMDWFALAGSINQLSLVPFLGLLWTLWHIPSAPRRTVQGFTFYLVFIGVTIPVGIYCRQQLGTPLANVDWLHGPCEALLTTANLLIVLGLRDALKQAPPDGPHADNTASSSSSSSSSSSTSSAGSESIRGSPSSDAAGDNSRVSSDATQHSPNDAEAGGMPSNQSVRQSAAAGAAAHQRPWSHLPDDRRQCDTGTRYDQPTPRSLDAAGHQPAAHHQLLGPHTHVPSHTHMQPLCHHRRGPGTPRCRHVGHISIRCCSGLRGVPRVAVVSRGAQCVPALHGGCCML